MKRRIGFIVGLLAIVILLPLLLRRQTATTSPGDAQDRLVILTPHNESIRNEYGEAFAAYWKKSTGRSIYIDWRTPGGSSEIRMVLDAGYEAAKETGRPGIGVDLFFGGGEPDFTSQAKQGRFETLSVFHEHPAWFEDGGAIPEIFTGERYYAKNHVWIGTCLSQFGICYNPAMLRRLKLPSPTAWNDLGNPGYAGALALADPTKSGSVARTFELIVQGEIQRAIAAPGVDRREAINAGWSSGLQLIQRMAANARYFTDSAPKIPQDVGQGNAAAGMCIDFYGRSYAQDLTSADGSPRLIWIAPHGGTTLSSDPIAVLKGAPHPQIAQAFVDFCLSDLGQILWFSKLGTTGGPKEHNLHRMPIRSDIYTSVNLANSSMPHAHPYHDPGNFNYQRDLTGGSFNTLRKLVKVMCIDSHEEMKSAWLALREAGMPADALAVFQDVSMLPYDQFGKGNSTLDGHDTLKAADYATLLGEQFRENYRKAESMAKQHSKL
jgi:iron(III) transport system substrate-binding protein